MLTEKDEEQLDSLWEKSPEPFKQSYFYFKKMILEVPNLFIRLSLGGVPPEKQQELDKELKAAYGDKVFVSLLADEYINIWSDEEGQKFITALADKIKQKKGLKSEEEESISVSALVEKGFFKDAIKRASELQLQGFHDIIWELAQTLQRDPEMDKLQLIELYKTIRRDNPHYKEAKMIIPIIYGELGKKNEMFAAAFETKQQNLIDQIFSNCAGYERLDPIVKNIGSVESLSELATLIKNLKQENEQLKAKVLKEEEKGSEGPSFFSRT